MEGPLPPHTRLPDFLPPGEHRALLDWALANRHRFAPATVTAGRIDSEERVDSDRRVAGILRDLGPLQPVLRKRLLDALPMIVAGTGSGGPAPRSLELELAAHGDGAHFAPHVDVPIGTGRKPLGGRAGFNDDRLLSAVYYFHAEPKAFTGGELRLFRFGADPAEITTAPGDHIDLEPLQNSLVAFPSWAPHEVRRVSCPSRSFANYRFALNAWYCAPLTKAS